MTKKKIKNGKTIITHILLMIFALIQIYPLFWLFEFSLKDNAGGPKPDKYGGQQGAASIGTGGLSAAKAGGHHRKGGDQHQRE